MMKLLQYYMTGGCNMKKHLANIIILTLTVSRESKKKSFVYKFYGDHTIFFNRPSREITAQYFVSLLFDNIQRYVFEQVRIQLMNYMEAFMYK